MKRRWQPAWIGAFIVVAGGLFIVAIAAFGSGALLRPRLEYVMYFEGSVKGLTAGAPVTFRGVKVGSVSDVRVDTEAMEAVVRIPVRVQIDPLSLTGSSGYRGRREARVLIPRLVDRGLRGRLELQSFVTGQYMINLDFYPDDPPRYLAAGGDLPELPTIPSQLETLTKSFEKLPIEEILAQVQNVVTGMDQLINDPNLREGVAGLNRSLQDLQTLLDGINSRVGPVAAQIGDTTTALSDLIKDVDRQVEPIAAGIRTTMDETGALVKSLNQQIETVGPSVKDAADSASKALAQAEETLGMQSGPVAELAKELRSTSDRLQDTLLQMEKTLEALENATGEGSPLRYEATRTLHELAAAARAMRSMAEYLQRHPEALLRGKGEAEDDQ